MNTNAEGLQVFFRVCGSLLLVFSCFGRALPWTVRLALLFSLSILFCGMSSLSEFVSSRSTLDALFPILFPELLTGILVVLPACLACWAMTLFAEWSTALVFPHRRLWFSSFASPPSPHPWMDPEQFSRVRTLTLSLVLFASLSFFPFLPELFARLGESLLEFPLATAGRFADVRSWQNLLLGSTKIAWMAALGLALPLLSLSLAFDLGLALIARYARPLAGDPGFLSLRTLLLGAALCASLYSLSAMVEKLSESGVSNRRAAEVLQVFHAKP